MKKVLCLIFCVCLILPSIILPSGATPAEEKTYDGYIEAFATPITNGYFSSTTSGGSRNPSVINDGVVLSKTNSNATHQFDTYVAGKSECDEYIGYEFGKTYTVKRVEYQLGSASVSGGWFVGDDSLRLEMLVDGEWIEAASDISTVYPRATEYSAETFPNYEIYIITLSKAQVCEGIRVFGKAGGAKNYVSCAELRVLASGLKIEGGYVESISGPISGSPVTVRSTTSGGSRRLSTIKDGITVAADNTDNKLQYDDYWASNTAHKDYFGYEFPHTFTVERLEFQAGTMFESGGWFANGVVVQALIDGAWTEVASDAGEVYPSSNDIASFSSFENYIFTLDVPVSCDGIRIYGEAGGSKYFVSCTELKVATNERHGTAFRGYQEIPVSDGKYSVRFLATMDTLDCTEAGFIIDIAMSDDTVKHVSRSVRQVYSSVYADSVRHTAAELGGEYIFAITIRDIPLSAGDLEFTVTPYCIDSYGTHMAQPFSVKYSNGVSVS